MGFPAVIPHPPVADSPAAVPLAPLEGVELGPVLSEAIGRCPVCSNPADDRVVSCPYCQTSHHEECVQFNGACGVFGCGCGAPVDASTALEPVGSVSLMYSLPVRFLLRIHVSYVWLATVGLVSLVVLVDPTVLLCPEMLLNSTLFVFLGTGISWLCKSVMELVERSC